MANQNDLYLPNEPTGNGLQDTPPYLSFRALFGLDIKTGQAWSQYSQ